MGERWANDWLSSGAGALICEGERWANDWLSSGTGALICEGKRWVNDWLSSDVGALICEGRTMGRTIELVIKAKFDNKSLLQKSPLKAHC